MCYMKIEPDHSLGQSVFWRIPGEYLSLYLLDSLEGVPGYSGYCSYCSLVMTPVGFRSSCMTPGVGASRSMYFLFSVLVYGVSLQ